MDKKRFDELDCLKLTAIFLVVVGHIVDTRTAQSPDFRSLFIFIYMFHMPLFIFLSGLFDSPNRGRVTQRARSFVALYLLEKLLMMIAGLLSSGKASFSLLTEGGIAWFMFALAAWMVLSHATRNLPLLPLLALAASVSLAVGYDANVGDFLCLSRIIVFFPFYLIGYRLKPEAVLVVLHRRGAFVAAMVMFAVFAIACVVGRDVVYLLRPLTTGRNPYAVLGTPGLGPVLRLLWYVIASLLVVAAIAIASRVKVAWMARLGKRTLSVYLLHWPLITLLAIVIDFGQLGASPAGKLAMVLTAFPVTLVCASDPVFRMCSRFQAVFKGATCRMTAE